MAKPKGTRSQGPSQNTRSELSETYVPYSRNDDPPTRNSRRGRPPGGLRRQSIPGSLYGQDPYRTGVEE